MSRQIPPMPPEEDRHMIIYSQGNLEPAQPEPPSRSPSPDLPPNFVPKPPVESSNFPAANNIISLLNRMSGGASLRDLIVVPAATWDRNNTMWEHKMAQLRKKHRKEWGEKEVELRRKYDEQYSDARYREMLLAKEMKEMEFAQGVASGEIFGKTWKEHKAAKKDMEKTYTEKLQETEMKLAESESTVKELRKTLAEKETAIEALQNAIGRRADRISAEETKQPQQPQQFQQPQTPQYQQPQIPQFQQLQTPQYQMPQLNPSTVVVQGLGHPPTPQAFFHQPPPSIQELQYTLQQQQYQQQPQVEDQSMAMVRAGTFRNTSGIVGHTSLGGSPAVGGCFGIPSHSFGSISGVNTSPSRPGHQGGQHIGNRQQDQGGNRDNVFRNSQGNDRYRGSGEHTLSDSQGRSGLHGPRDNPSANPPGVVVGNPSDQQASYLAPELPTVALWNNAFSTPQNKSIATKESSLVPPPPPNTKSTTPRPTSGLKGPFGSQSQAVVPYPISFGQISDNSPSAFEALRGSIERPNGATTKSVPFRVSVQEKTLDIVMQEADPGAIGVTKARGGRKPSVRRTDEGSRSRKRRHSASPPSRRVSSRLKKPQQEDEDQPDLPQSSPEATERYPEGATMCQEEIDKAIDDATAEYTEPKMAVADEDLISEVDLTKEEENTAADIVKASSDQERIVCVKLKDGVAWSGPEYIMNKIRGGALEAVHVYDRDREVYASFINPVAAKRFYDFFNQNPDAKEAFIRFKLFVRWVSDSISPISPDLAEVIANGATRCLKVFQIPNDRLVEDIKADFSRQKGIFSVLSVHLSTEKSRRKVNGGMGKVAKIEFFCIMLALETKEKIQSGDMGGYLNCDVEFTDDPCEKKDGKLLSIDSMRTWPI